MIPTTLQSPSGGFLAAVRFHDGRLLTPVYTAFDSVESAYAFAEGWIAQAIRSHIQALTATGDRLRLVEG
jgi:hypothetical protein